jgi:glycolate oxidase
VRVMRMLDRTLITQIAAVVGGENTLVGEGAVARYRSDASGALPGAAEGDRAAAALVVAKPRTTDEVSRIVALAAGAGVPVIPRGAGTGLWGGAAAPSGGIVISTERMAAGPEIHREDLYVIAGPGMTTGSLRAAVEAQGLFYPIDPANQAVCTIGGNVAEDAVGLRGLKYGTTRNYVLGSEIVTPEAKVIKVGARTVKSVAGYDVTRLMVGSAGTLAVVTSVTLKVVPMPEERYAMAFALPAAVMAAGAAAEIMALGFPLAALEIMDEGTAKVARTYLGEGAGQGSLVIVEIDGPRTLCEAAASKVKELMRNAFQAGAPDEARRSDCERIWRLRRAAFAGISTLAPVVVADVSGPHPNLAAAVGATYGSVEHHGVNAFVFGHAGERRLHVALAASGSGEEPAIGLAAAMGALRAAYAGLGVDLSCERSLGLGPVKHVRLCASGAGFDVMMRLKRTMDPKGIMNPGKMFHEA